MQTRLTIETSLYSRIDSRHTREFMVNPKEARDFVDAWTANCTERVIKVLALQIPDRGVVHFRSDTILAVAFEDFNPVEVEAKFREMEQQQKQLNADKTNVASAIDRADAWTWALPGSLLR